MAETAKMDITVINPTSLSMVQLKEDAIDILAGEYADEKGVTDDILRAIRTEYATKSRQDQYHQALASGDAMKYLCVHYGYPTIKIDKDEKQVTDDKKEFDLLHAYEHIPGKIGADEKWIDNANDLLNELTYRAMMALGSNEVEKLMKDNPYCKKLKEIDAAIKNGENPLSKTALHRSLETTVQAMLGEDVHISKHDTMLVMLTFVVNQRKDSRAVTTADLKGFLPLLLKVCHRITTNAEGYFVKSKILKKKKG